MRYKLQAGRDRDILRCLIDSHVVTASPVGSRSIASRFSESVSPATVRNTMGELEEAGYISRPHTSAGGVPTDKGYRFYVDRLIRNTPLSPTEARRLRQEVQRREWNNVQEVLDYTAQVLGVVCKELGIALTPRLYEGIFQKLELIPMAERKILMVLMITSGLVRTIVAEVDSAISPRALKETGRILNERFSGCSLREIKQQLDARVKDARRAHPTLVQLFIQSADYLFDFQENERIHVGGATQIVSQPEFSDHEKLSHLFGFLEQKQDFARWLQARSHTDNVTVSIGHEHRRGAIQSCSVVTSTYKIGETTGIIGVIGPTRMRYGRLVSIVRYTSRLLNMMFA